MKVNRRNKKDEGRYLSFDNKMFMKELYTIAYNITGNLRSKIELMKLGARKSRTPKRLVRK